MRIARAHSYADVQLARTWYKVLPRAWRAAIDAAGFEWFILPEDLDVFWIGLAHESWRGWIDPTVNSGFCCYWPWGPWSRPYIYVQGQHGYAVPHEAAHALGYVWGEDLEHWYRPERAVSLYGATNASEYWATAVEAFLRVAPDAAANEHDLARLHPDLYAYLDSRWREAA